MTIIAVFNQKGGVEETITFLNQAAALSRRDRRPIGINLDPQAQFSSMVDAARTSVKLHYGMSLRNYRSNI